MAPIRRGRVWSGHCGRSPPQPTSEVCNIPWLVIESGTNRPLNHKPLRRLFLRVHRLRALRAGGPADEFVVRRDQSRSAPERQRCDEAIGRVVG